MADEEPARVGNLNKASKFAHDLTGGGIFVLDRRDFACPAARCSRRQKVS